MIASLNQTWQSGCVMNVNAPHKIFELWGNGFSESVIISDSKDEYRRGGAEKQHSVEFTGICVCTFETPSLKNQPWLCWRRIHTGLTYWLKLPHSTFKEVAQHYSTSAFFKRIVFLKSECINVWLSVNWICQRQVCLFFYFCGKFELSFFNILSLKVIGVVLPPPPQAGALDVYRINKALLLPSLYFSSTRTHESVRQSAPQQTCSSFSNAMNKLEHKRRKKWEKHVRKQFKGLKKG